MYYGIAGMKQDGVSNFWVKPLSGFFNLNNPALCCIFGNDYYTYSKLAVGDTVKEGLIKGKMSDGSVTWISPSFNDQNVHDLNFFTDGTPVFFQGSSGLFPTLTTLNKADGTVAAQVGMVDGQTFLDSWSDYYGNQSFLHMLGNNVVAIVSGTGGVEGGTPRLVCLDKTLTKRWSVDFISSEAKGDTINSKTYAYYGILGTSIPRIFSTQGNKVYTIFNTWKGFEVSQIDPNGSVVSSFYYKPSPSRGCFNVLGAWIFDGQILVLSQWYYPFGREWDPDPGNPITSQRAIYSWTLLFSNGNVGWEQKFAYPRDETWFGMYNRLGNDPPPPGTPIVWTKTPPQGAWYAYSDVKVLNTGLDIAPEEHVYFPDGKEYPPPKDDAYLQDKISGLNAPLISYVTVCSDGVLAVTGEIEGGPQQNRPQSYSPFTVWKIDHIGASVTGTIPRNPDTTQRQDFVVYKKFAYYRDYDKKFQKMGSGL